MKSWHLLVLACLPSIVLLVLGLDAGGTIERLATENEQIRLSDNRTTRARSGFRSPGLQEWDYRGVSSCAAAVGWPPAMLMALRRTENGGRLLDLGIQWIPENVRRDYPPALWQYAAGQQIMMEVAGQMVFEDRKVFDKFADRLAERWGARDTAAWRKNFKYFVRQEAKRPGANGRHSNGGKKR